MLRLLFMLSVAGLMNACNNEGTTGSASDTTATTMNTETPLLTETEIAEGWVSLFDGKTTKGWHKYGGFPVGSAWKVEDGALHLDANQKITGRSKTVVIL